MAQRVQVFLDDDIDSSAAVGTFAFGLEEETYEIDLNEENIGALRERLQPFIDHARRTTRGAKAVTTRKISMPAGMPAKVDNKRIRAWAKEQGLEVPSRGRIPADIVEKFQAA